MVGYKSKYLFYYSDGEKWYSTSRSLNEIPREIDPPDLKGLRKLRQDEVKSLICRTCLIGHSSKSIWGASFAEAMNDYYSS